jgi:hypothetical protein
MLSIRTGASARFILVGGASGAFWMRFGRDVLAVSIAEPHLAPKHLPAPGQTPVALVPSRFAVAHELAASAASSGALRALGARVGASLGVDGRPLTIENQVVGLDFEATRSAVQGGLDALNRDARGAGALLVRYQRGSRPGFDRLALVPTTEEATVVRLMGTAGGGLSAEDVVAWLQTLRGARVVGVGEHFIEVWLEGRRTDAPPSCPGTTLPAPGPAGEDRSDRLVCEWSP